MPRSPRRRLGLVLTALAILTALGAPGSVVRAEEVSPVQTVPERASTYGPGALRPIEPFGQPSVGPPATPTAGRPGPVQRPLDAQVAEQVRYWSDEHQLDPLLVWAIIEAESGGNPRAVSPVGALGLMQVMPDHFETGEDPFDIPTNIRHGTTILSSYLAATGSLKLGVAAYNAGPYAVQRYNGVPPYEETQRFVRNVLGRYQQLLARAASDEPARQAPARPAEPQVVPLPAPDVPIPLR